ncbi:hypothetical protein AWJ20_1015 [Sugiyamaella lignohabitans]|uniref:Fungal-type protein kinase domain-containing protein n=1 Tax=Sugiyamaella lignohabitans TaxID=796027 RepID=A0A161HJ88_9ASCO|nr:uncharacterized protein AWJ20_1015 [Sugiyamaella lignohabitans]ANB12747.1 hypothetical protein AWJ20_1015 [Sugiyamaella lignohabitans]
MSTTIYQEYPDADKGVLEIYKNIEGVQKKFFPQNIDELVSAVVNELSSDKFYDLDECQWNVEVESDDAVERVEYVIGKILHLVQQVDPPPRGKLLYCGTASPEIMVPIIIESKSSDDLKVWRKLSHIVRYVINSQDSRRYVQALTVCGTKARLWIYDRSGAFSSKPFDIDKDWLRFVEVILGYYMMTDSELGFDSTIYYDEQTRQRYVKLPVIN